ncbi:hypothetical protein Fcan01_22065 [Folsomia candida]|uniref:Uncharacterized protein n=1 Tax=Folsomia candida TaxID=158441 RepID=A0A226DCN9_FOLCA|nr:hypothetical protein Fcan01_22065 [Folsomia candida]
MQIRMFKLQSIFSLLYTIATFLCVCFGRLTLTEKFQGSVFLILDILLTATRWNYSLDPSPGQIVNVFINFEKEILKGHPNPPTSLGTELMRIVVPLATISLTAVPVLELLLLLFVPCTPPFLLSMFPNCKECSANVDVIKFWIRLFESWVQWHIALSGGTWVIFILLVGVVCIVTYIRVLSSEISRIQQSQDMDACIRLYKCIQMLEKSFNDFLMDRIVPAMLLCSPGVQLIVQYVCINHHNDIPMPGFLVFPIIGWNGGITNVLVYSLASGIHSASEAALVGIKNKLVGLQGQKLIKGSLELVPY